MHVMEYDWWENYFLGRLAIAIVIYTTCHAMPCHRTSTVTRIHHWLLLNFKWIIPGIILWNGIRILSAFNATLLSVLAFSVLSGLLIISVPPAIQSKAHKSIRLTRGLRGILKRIQHPLFTLWIVNQKHESLGNKHKKFVLGVFSHAGISFSYNKLPTRFDRNNFPQLNFFLFSNQNEKDFPPMGEISHINNDFIM